MSEKGKRLRKLLQEERIIVAPGVYDAIGAKLVEMIGFDALYLTGFGCSASLLGKPDLGLLTLTELATQAKNIDNAVDIPVIADGEAGFGNALNTARAIREYEKSGVSALHIEDQVYKPDGKPQVVPMEEHISKIKSAVAARTDKNLVIIGRTDALRKYGLKEAIKRANAYFKAGCDMIFVHGPATIDELKIIAKEISAPQVINYSTMIESGNKPILSVSELEEMGFKMVIFPSILLFITIPIMKEALLEFRETGGLIRHQKRMISVPEFKKIIGWDRFVKKEGRYLPDGIRRGLK